VQVCNVGEVQLCDELITHYLQPAGIV